MMAILTKLPKKAETQYRSLQEILIRAHQITGSWEGVREMLERQHGYSGSKALLHRIVNEEKGHYYPNNPEICKQLGIPFFEMEMKWSKDAEEKQTSTRERFRIDLDPDINEGLKTLIRALPRSVRTQVLVERALEEKEGE